MVANASVVLFRLTLEHVTRVSVKELKLCHGVDIDSTNRQLALLLGFEGFLVTICEADDGAVALRFGVNAPFAGFSELWPQIAARGASALLKALRSVKICRCGA